MAHKNKLLIKILNKRLHNNIPFVDIYNLLLSLNFSCKIKGGHHIFYKKGIDEIINIQPKKNEAKPYQVKQIKTIIIKYNLGR